MKSYQWILIICFVVSGFCSVVVTDAAEKAIPSLDQRFGTADVQESPSFQRHVVPLLSRLGCNGRACHGSFQGRGGFRLSLFGYDFQGDHAALMDKESPRVDKQQPLESLILIKPTDADNHEGGLRYKKGGWEYHVLRRWVESGAADAEKIDQLQGLQISPAEIVFDKAGQTEQLKVIACWADGTREDVTPLCRYVTNDGQVAKIDKNGLVTAGTVGDSHVVVNYDKAVVPVPVIQPVSDRVGARYPQVSTSTRIDELVVSKLRKVGIVPSVLCTDAEFLRRVSLDMTGTLPTTAEVKEFLTDTSKDKRQRKIDELLKRPAYAAWWSTKLCDFTGNNSDSLNNVVPRGNGVTRTASQDWYEWIKLRIAENIPYDELVAGVVLAASRNPGEDFSDYCNNLSRVYSGASDEGYANRQSMPHYWARRSFRESEERVIGFAYSFLGLRIQCAQCHKHPFDQWTQDDFEQFSGFLTSTKFGNNPASKTEYNQLLETLKLKGKKGGDLRREIGKLLKEGKTIPFQEVYTATPKRSNKQKVDIDQLRQQAKNMAARLVILKDKGQQEAVVATQKGLVRLQKRIKAEERTRAQGPSGTAKLLGGEVIDLTQFDDPRQPLMDWLRAPENPYFAQAFVNRVWATYFNVGIVDPPDDMSLGNPPSNKPLLDYLAQGFIEHDFDMHWLHREIVSSDTYQRSWQPNDTNRSDQRNFSRAVPRRLPAEVTYDAIQYAAASDARVEQMQKDLAGRAVLIPGSGTRYLGSNREAQYALTIFGRSMRETNCDCDRTEDVSLLQTVYLQNDQQLLDQLTDRNDSWLAQIQREYKIGKPAPVNARKAPRRPDNYDQLVRSRKAKIKQLRAAGKDETAVKLERQLRSYVKRFAGNKEPVKQTSPERQLPAAEVASKIVQGAYLRTLSRYPTEQELARSVKYLGESVDVAQGAKDLLWVLLNTKEFILNH
ncbi:MAG: DUF1549 domain-containing protein [Pirellulaceae bacterium]